MKAFMDQDFLLETETAKMLYHDYAADAGFRLPLSYQSAGNRRGQTV